MGVCWDCRSWRPIAGEAARGVCNAISAHAAEPDPPPEAFVRVESAVPVDGWLLTAAAFGCALHTAEPPPVLP